MEKGSPFQQMLLEQLDTDMQEKINLYLNLIPYPNIKSKWIIALSIQYRMDLESVIQSEVSQKEKNKYRMLTHIYGNLKKKKRF